MQNGPTQQDDPTFKVSIASWGLAWVRKCSRSSSAAISFSGRIRKFGRLFKISSRFLFEPKKRQNQQKPHKHITRKPIETNSLCNLRRVGRMNAWPRGDRVAPIATAGPLRLRSRTWGERLLSGRGLPPTARRNERYKDGKASLLR
jgi:hypothetical protein